MQALVLIKMVPDVVEELEVDASGTALDPETVRLIPNESDDHSLEQALLMKERHGGRVTVAALGGPGVEEALYHALARGADRAVTIAGAPENSTVAECAAVYARALPALGPADVILTGVQSIDDLDGLLAPTLAAQLGLPYLGIVSALSINGEGVALAVKEYPSGVRGEFEIDLPAVFGISSAERPRRYVPVAKVRVAMKTQKIDRVNVPPAEDRSSRLTVVALHKPQAAGHAEMLEDGAGSAAQKLCGILIEKGLL